MKSEIRLRVLVVVSLLMNLFLILSGLRHELQIGRLQAQVQDQEELIDALIVAVEQDTTGSSVLQNSMLSIGNYEDRLIPFLQDAAETAQIQFELEPYSPSCRENRCPDEGYQAFWIERDYSQLFWDTLCELHEEEFPLCNPYFPPTPEPQDPQFIG